MPIFNWIYNYSETCHHEKHLFPTVSNNKWLDINGRFALDTKEWFEHKLHLNLGDFVVFKIPGVQWPWLGKTIKIC